uniref:Glucose-repressible alcohol dehydrogenase transcriptional effector n=1 Tax=Zeugodacus cucurbitae TaxID=28588 RepID=A0A0A1WZM3_ZEUCU
MFIKLKIQQQPKAKAQYYQKLSQAVFCRQDKENHECNEIFLTVLKLLNSNESFLKALKLFNSNENFLRALRLFNSNVSFLTALKFLNSNENVLTVKVFWQL